MSIPPTGPEENVSSQRGRNSLGRLYRLVRKELSEILRDRRTIVTLVLMPLLLYPLLSIAFQQVAASMLKPDQLKGKSSEAAAGEEEPEYRIGVESEEQLFVINKVLSAGENFHRSKLPKWQPYLSDDLDADVQSGRLDAGMRVLKGKLPRTLRRDEAKPETYDDFLNREITLQIISLEGSVISRKAADILERRLLWFHQRMVSHRLLDHNPYRPIVLAHLEYRTLQQAGDGNIISLPALVPLILILMTITGAVYPAIDTTAGERERGTLEMLVAAPVPRLGLLFAKYVTVVAVAVLTGVVNLAAMTVTLKFSQLERQVVPGGISAEVLLQVVALLFLFALFFSALLLSLTSFARSFKEAQAYLIPLMLVSLGPGIIGVLPGIKLEGFFIVAPLVNIVLLGRDLFEGHVDPTNVVLVVGITLVYAGAAIALAARVFGAESVLYSEQSGWSDLFRRPEEPRETASVASAVWCLALMIPVHYVLQGSIHLAGVVDLLWQIAWVPVISLVLFLAFPLLATWLGRVRPTTGFALRSTDAMSIAAAILLGISLWPGTLWILSQFVENQGLPDDALRYMRAMRREYPLAMYLMVMIPAAAEEIFFRGFLFTALARVMRPKATILITALLFALMHVVMGGPLGTARFWPSLFMGLLLGWTRYSTGSVLPGLLLHVLYNGSLEFAAQHQEMAGMLLELNLVGMGAIRPVVIASAAALFLGNFLLYLVYRSRRNDENRELVTETFGSRLMR